MAYWLFKTEAETFSWDMQKKKGAKGAEGPGDASSGTPSCTMPELRWIRDRHRKVEFRQGTVGAWASKAVASDECSRCSGDGLIYEPVNLPPPCAMP